MESEQSAVRKSDFLVRISQIPPPTTPPPTIPMFTASSEVLDSDAGYKMKE